MNEAIAHITIGVADLGPVFALWKDRFGLECVAQRTGPDESLARLWGIPAEQIEAQALFAMTGVHTGRLHFVRFGNPDPPVRQGAAATDLGPKNLDVNCHDMPSRVAELKAAGYRFRSDIGEYRVDGIHAREVQMSGHDETNIVLIEVLSEGFDLALTPQGYASVTSFVVIVPDTRTEADFYHDVFGFEKLMHHHLSGPGIEQAVGLPAGAVLDMRLMGQHEKFFGRAELIAYQGIGGCDRFKRAKPPALGTLRCGIAVSSVTETLQKARAAGIDAAEHEGVHTVYGAGRFVTLSSPAGLDIEVYSRDEPL